MSDKSFVFYWHVITTHCKYAYNRVAHESIWIIINTFYKYIICVVQNALKLHQNFLML